MSFILLIFVNQIGIFTKNNYTLYWFLVELRDLLEDPSMKNFLISISPDYYYFNSNKQQQV